MSYYILCRTQMGALIAIQGSDDDGIAEFDSKVKAEAAADDNLHCQAGFYSIEETDF